MIFVFASQTVQTQHPAVLFHIRPQLIQLDMSERQVFEEALMQFPTLRSAPRRHVRKVLSCISMTCSCNADTSIPSTSKLIAMHTTLDRVSADSTRYASV